MNRRPRGAATLVAAGILLSRIAGLVRQRVLSHFLGLGLAADAFAAAFRIPNFLQNLFGEGVLSASFIPVYTRLEAEGRHAEARRLAGAVAGLLALVVAVLVAVGITAAPWLLGLLFPGFTGEKRDLALRLTRILFPGTGLLVLSAWCLGVLNSHRRFFLSYTAPVVWNLAIIAATLAPGGADPGRRVLWAAWGAVAGSLLQFAVQIPTVLLAAPGLRWSLDHRMPEVRRVLGNFGPAFLSRGVAQISAFVDGLLASLLPTGAVAALLNAQTLYQLPGSLFGMSVVAAELPELSETAGRNEPGHGALRARLEDAMRRVAYFIIPSAVALGGLGQVAAGAVYQSGAFTAGDARYVWGVLVGATVGLLANVLGRLYASTFWALHDTRTPLRFATIRLLLTSLLGYLAAIPLPPLLGLAPRWGVAGLTASAGLAGWIEFLQLRGALTARIGTARFQGGYLARVWGAALLSLATGWGALVLLGGRVGPIVAAAVVLGGFSATYLLATRALGLREARMVFDRLGRKR